MEMFNMMDQWWSTRPPEPDDWPSITNGSTNDTLDSAWGGVFGTNLTLNTTSAPYRPPVPYSERLETYLVPAVFAIIFVVGVLGNGTLVLIFLRHRNMRNVPNTYIFSLALGDLLVILTCVPFTSTVYTYESWPYGLLICKLSESAKDVSIGVSVFTLTALSADRFFAIVDPMRKLHTGGGGRRATRITICIAACIWLLALACAAPAAAYSYLRVFGNGSYSFEACYPFPEELGEEYARAMVDARFVVYYFIPLLVIAVFYSLMARHLVRSTRNMPGEMQGTARHQVRARKKVAKMVLSFVVVFALCFFPHHLFMLWFYHTPSAQNDYNSAWHTIRILGFCLTFGNSCINPIALYCVSGTFRKHFKRYLLCLRCRRRRRKLGRGGGGGSSKGSGCGGGGSAFGGGGGGPFGGSVGRRGGTTLASTLTSSKSLRDTTRCYTTRSITWESNTFAHVGGTQLLRRHPHAAVVLQHSDDVTVTMFLNGAGGGGGGGGGAAAGAGAAAAAEVPSAADNAESISWDRV